MSFILYKNDVITINNGALCLVASDFIKHNNKSFLEVLANQGLCLSSIYYSSFKGKLKKIPKSTL